MSEPITRFFGEFRKLSNFWESDVVLDSVTYPTVEHAYQAAKTMNLEKRAWILASEWANGAKQRGAKVPLRPDWEGVKLGVMEHLLRQKFSQREFKKFLKGTEHRELVEGNYWHDNFWGQCTCSKHIGQGQNHLGKLLMKLRAELQQGLELIS